MVELIVVLTVSTAFLRMLNLDKSDQLSTCNHTPEGVAQNRIFCRFIRSGLKKRRNITGKDFTQIMNHAHAYDFIHVCFRKLMCNMSSCCILGAWNSSAFVSVTAQFTIACSGKI